MKHTEGPWHVWSEQYPRVGPTHNCTVAGVFACPSGDQQANAQLIAAAPELLQVVKDLLAEMCGSGKSCGHDFCCVCASQKARSIIAKVENRECYRS